MKNTSKVPEILRQYALEFAVLLFGLAAVNGIFVVHVYRKFNAEYAAQIGSFVGGYIGPIFALIGVVLLVTTLRNQRLSSAQQNFETKYFELLKMHRDNVAEISIKDRTGRGVFVLLLRELRCALEIVRAIAKRYNERLSNRQLLHVAYYCLFFGVGPNSSRMLKISLAGFNKTFIDAVERELSKRETKERVAAERHFRYVPFEGHQSRLGHYYRHLYQLVKYVDSQKADVVNDKYESVKTVRAQLSTHEQALLLVNSLTPVGRNWWSNNFIVNYRLVQNIPLEFFDDKTELELREFFKPGYFEWEENTERIGTT